MRLLHWLRAQWDRALATLLFASGALALLLGWLGVRDEALTVLQVPYIVSGGIGGILLVSVGATLWVSADLRDEWRILDDLAAAIRSHSPSLLADDAAAENPWPVAYGRSHGVESAASAEHGADETASLLRAPG